MKIKKIVDLCKKSGRCVFYNTDEGQWLSDGGAAYPLMNLPDFDSMSFCQTYDINDKAAEKIVFKQITGLPEGISFADTNEGEEISVRGKIAIFAGGKKLIPYQTSTGIAFVDQKYLAPLADIEDNLLELYERYTKSGQLYFAAKTGLLLVAVIFPVNIVEKQFVGLLKDLTKRCEAALFAKGSSSEMENAQMSLLEEE